MKGPKINKVAQAVRNILLERKRLTQIAERKDAIKSSKV